MTTSFPQKYSLARGAATFLNYLHLDALVTALVFVFVLVVGVTSNFSVTRSIRLALPEFTLSSEETPAAPAPAAQVLTPALAAALDHVVQRYRVAPEALLPVFAAAQAAARERRLDPMLIIAVISVESGFNPFSQSVMGAQGLMQIIPRYHQDKLPKAAPAQPFLDPVTNVRIGAQILQEAIRRQGGLIEGLQYYAGATDDGERGYANKVLAEKLRLEQAARRKDAAGA